VYERMIDGTQPTFGVSGKLFNSDLLMYDRATDSFWSQIHGRAVVGPLTGRALKPFPSEIMTWGEWRTRYPETEVLSSFTGQMREYTAFPYRNYFESDELWFTVSATDDRLHPKAPVTGVELPGDVYVAYPDAFVAEHGIIHDEPGGIPLLVMADPDAHANIAVFDRRVDGRALTFSWVDGTLTDDQTGSGWSFNGHAISGEMTGQELIRLVPVRAFWFAWFSFHQDTLLWGR
jgi:hypothetical protein